MKGKPRWDLKQVALQWGLPDWHEASRYPDHRAVGITKWCWEFLRRSKEYRNFWRDEVLPQLKRRETLPQRVEQLIADKKDSEEANALSSEILATLPFAEGKPLLERLRGGTTRVGPMPEECLLGGGTRFGMAEAMRRFGLFYAIDPRMSEQGQPVFATGVTEHLAGVVDWDPHMVTVDLDTRLPDKPQLDQVKSILSQRRHMLEFQSLPEQQKRNILKGALSGKGLRPKSRSPEARRHVKLYADYLRVLDAKESGASDQKIAKVVFPNRSSSEGLKRVKNFYRAARRLRDGGWRQLLPVGSK